MGVEDLNISRPEDGVPDNNNEEIKYPEWLSYDEAPIPDFSFRGDFEDAQKQRELLIESLQGLNFYHNSDDVSYQSFEGLSPKDETNARIEITILLGKLAWYNKLITGGTLDEYGNLSIPDENNKEVWENKYANFVSYNDPSEESVDFIKHDYKDISDDDIWEQRRRLVETELYYNVEIKDGEAVLHSWSTEEEKRQVRSQLFELSFLNKLLSSNNEK